MSMLYKAPGPYFCDGHMVDYVVVDMDQDEEYIAQGWFRSIADAVAAKESKPADSVVVTPAEKVEVAAIEAPKRRGRPPKVSNVD